MAENLEEFPVIPAQIALWRAQKVSKSEIERKIRFFPEIGRLQLKCDLAALF